MRGGRLHEGVPSLLRHHVGVILPHLHHVKHSFQQPTLQVDCLNDLILVNTQVCQVDIIIIYSNNKHIHIGKKGYAGESATADYPITAVITVLFG